MKNLLNQIKEAKKEAKDLTLKWDKFAFGQGWEIRYRDNLGEVVELMSFESPITLKAIKEVIDQHKQHTSLNEVWVEGRFVGASSLHDYMNNEDYIENINYWEVNIPKEEI
tara:strand:+ start:2168 stop:2500 length:333 start_codon:yes stop_codon:yes gene_type:complete